MKRIAALAALCACVVPVACFAQATAGEGKFAYCKVTDNGGHKIWVSQVFPVPAQTGLLDTAMASEFHTYVAGLGGAGDKDCLVTLTREAAQETRGRIEAIMRKRVFGISVFKWHDVAWTPSATALAVATAPASTVAAESFIYCRGVDTDARKLVTTAIFVRPLPPVTSGLRFQELERYAREFGNRVQATHSLDPHPLCIASDSRAEAEKSHDDYRKSFAFTGVGKIDMAWEPGTAASTLPAARAAPEFAQAAAPYEVAAGPVDDVEADFWRRIASSRQAADFDEYLAAYPLGRHAPIARLEARRLRATSDAGHAAGVTDAAAPGPSTVPGGGASLADREFPIPDEVITRLSSEAFFQMPIAGDGATVRRSGQRHVPGAGTAHVDVEAQRVAGSNQCRVDETLRFEGKSAITIHSYGRAWAGLIPLSLRGRISHSAGTTDTTAKTLQLERLSGQPFPLVAGNVFGFVWTFENLAGSAGGRYVQTWSCKVGASGPAASIVPGMAGEQTEVRCDTRLNDMAPQTPVFHWLPATGCFLRDPDR